MLLLILVRKMRGVSSNNVFARADVIVVSLLGIAAVLGFLIKGDSLSAFTSLATPWIVKPVSIFLFCAVVGVLVVLKFRKKYLS